MARYANITGVETVAATFSRMSAAAAKKVTAALNAGAAEMVARAKTLAPTDSGRLRSSIQHRIEQGPRGVRAVIFVSALNPDDRFPYPRVIEFGRQKSGAGESVYRKHGKGGNKLTRRVSGGASFAAAQPFFWPAYWSVRKRMFARVQRAMAAAAKEAARNGG